MRQFTSNKVRYGLALAIAALFYSTGHAQGQHEKDISIKWQCSPDYNGKDNLSLQLVLVNNTQENFPLKDWDLYFNAVFPVAQQDNQDIKVSNTRGNLFQVEFKDRFIPANDSLVVQYKSQYAISGVSSYPNGFYFLNKLDNNKFLGVSDVSYRDLEPEKAANQEFLANLYDKNSTFTQKTEPIKIFPSPKSLTELKGSFRLSNGFLAQVEQPSWRDIVKSGLQDIAEVKLVEAGAKSNLQVQQNPSLSPEAYNLLISPDKITIEVSGKAGLFYALKSIASLHKYQASLNGKAVKSLPAVEVKDEPRYAYRGFMLDIARNFIPKQTLLKYIDLMADYKLNVFHLHFIEDEAWRIEIPGIPELTEVGARRSPSYLNGQALKPAYGSGADTTAKYLSRADFIEIIKYADQRNITVVPEIETPGHSRAAIKAMEYRYDKYMALGDKKKAEEYLLHDFHDISVYNSAQNFGDNILNPALPSVYNFLGKVIDEFKLMYQEAGVAFHKVSLGGDEVPAGVWEKSPKIKELMQKQGLTHVNQVWTYFIDKINQLCKSKGLHMAGWEEIGMVNKGSGMKQNPDMADKENMQLDVWNNVIGAGNDDLVYRLANAGYPTVLISASNLYFDMMWNTQKQEPGLKWATYADLYHSYSLLPEDYFANIHTYYSGKDLSQEYKQKLTRLSQQGRKNFLGIKGGLWTETVTSLPRVDYMVFPRFFVLAERAWSAPRNYESETNFNTQDFDKDYTSFIHRVSNVELKSLTGKVHYRLPAVGLKLTGDSFKANIEYPGFQVYYTLDGSKPSLSSQKYTIGKSVKVKKGDKIRIQVIDQDARKGPESSLEI